MRRKFPGLIVLAALALGGLITAAPLIWMISASFMPAGEANTVPPPFFPKTVTLDNYLALFRRLDIATHFLNSMIVATLATVLSLIINALAGYAFAKLRFAGRDRLFRFLLAGLVIPAQVGMLPLFLMLRSMGLVNTLAGAIIPFMATIFGIFLIRQYALSIPDDLLDAARVDGASEFRIFRTVVLPVLRPILATLAIFTFLSAWNDFMWPLIVLTDQGNFTLSVALAGLSGEHVQDTELMMAGSVVTVLPVLILFLALQRQYLRGVMMGSLKG